MKKHGYKRGSNDSNIYINIEDKNMIIVVVYVDDIIFGSNLQILSVNFVSEMKKEFEIVGWINILPGITSLSIRQRNLHFSNQVHESHA